MHRSRRREVAGILALLLTCFPASAGSISLQWRPNTDTATRGYRVYWGAGPRTYTSSLDVRTATSTVLSGLTDCAMSYVAVKAYDSGGRESTSHSNEVSGWPRPAITSVSPADAEEGRRLTLTLTGTNFRAGAAVRFLPAGITVNSVTVDSCTRIRVDATLARVFDGVVDVQATTAEGPYGVGRDLFTVTPSRQPWVVTGDPQNADTNVPTSVRPMIFFSEALRRSSVNTSTVRLLDWNRTPVAQASGSPTLSSDGRTATIIPASPLRTGRTYYLEVRDGSTGVVDLAGNPLVRSYTQSTGFRTASTASQTSEPDLEAPSLSGITVDGVGATWVDVAWSTSEPADAAVHYRRVGETDFRVDEVSPGLESTHVHRIEGLDPTRQYEFYVQSGDAAGNLAISSPPMRFTTRARRHAYLRAEAEAATFDSAWRRASGYGASSGAWLEVNADGEEDDLQTDVPIPVVARAGLEVDVPRSGLWHVWVRASQANDQPASLETRFLGYGEPGESTVQDAGWRWTFAGTFDLAYGWHQLDLTALSLGLRLDEVVVTDDPDFPAPPRASLDRGEPRRGLTETLESGSR